MQESSATYLFKMYIEGHILAENVSKIPHIVNGGQGNAILNKYLSGVC